jgi:hypothetical protein
MSVFVGINFAYYLKQTSEDRSNTRAELRNYEIMVDAYNSNPDFQELAAIFTITLGVRIAIDLVYNNTLGVFVQIIGRMVKNCFRFLFVFFMFILFYAGVGFIFFHDITSFKSYEDSILTLYAYGLGGFDFGVFDEAQSTSPLFGKIYLSFYLLFSLVLLLNFLIAILSDSYAALTQYSIGMKLAKVIQLRVIHDQHAYYSCLAKTTCVSAWLVLLLCPFILIFKSKKLNLAILKIEFFINAFIYKAIYYTALFALIPLIAVKVVILQIRAIKILTRSTSDLMWRILDLLICLILIVPGISTFLLYHSVAAFIGYLKTVGYVKATEVFKDEYTYMNKKSDMSFIKKDEQQREKHEIEREYASFKQYVTKNQGGMNIYNPTDMMISEIAMMCLIAVLKILNPIAIKYGNGYLPASLVVYAFREHFFVFRSFSEVLIHLEKDRESLEEDAKFNALVEHLADYLAGGNQNSDVHSRHPLDIEDNGNNLIVLTATLKNHEERKVFWSNKLNKLFTESNKYWLVDQFKYCKWFLFENVVEIAKSNYSEDFIPTKPREDGKEHEIPEDLKDFGAYLGIVRKRNTEDTIQSVNVSAMLSGVSNFETMCRDQIREITENGQIEISSKYARQMKELKKMNQDIYKEFSFRANNIALSNFE